MGITDEEEKRREERRREEKRRGLVKRKECLLAMPPNVRSRVVEY